ncbi:MAG: DUF2914 domain-containing protein [Thiohalomonadales bacterium]|nr:DUF2914 domain-containing protein [Thiohalomonadales bacterium]
MYKSGIIILTAFLGVASVHAEETQPQPSATMDEQTGEANTTSVTAQPAQEAATPSETPATITKESGAGANPEVQTGFNPGTVARSAFTTAIVDREPVDTLQEIEATDQKVYYFTELLDMQGQTATHRWEYNGKVMAEITFEVKGPRWRVWSSKNLRPDWLGEWKVSVLNSANDIIREDILNVVAMPATETMQPPAAPAVTPQ